MGLWTRLREGRSPITDCIAMGADLKSVLRRGRGKCKREDRRGERSIHGLRQRFRMDCELDRAGSKTRKGPHRKGAESFDLRRHGEKPESRVGKSGESGHVLHDRDLRAEEGAVDGARFAARVVDVVGVDADELHA